MVLSVDPLVRTTTSMMYSGVQNNSNNDNNNNNNINNVEPLVVCGPSGVGKGTLIEKLMNQFASKNVFGFSVSHTTRSPRPGERHGQHYMFTSHEEMTRAIQDGKFVEYAEVHGNLYGTSLESIAKLQSEQKITILDIDMQGVISVKESGIGANYIFIAPPSMEELENRLRGRATETEEAIQRRLGNAAREIAYGKAEGNFDFVFENHDADETVMEMVDVLKEWYPQLKEES
jgi:guanylate kinase